MIDDFSSIVFHFELCPVSWKYFYFELCNEISLPSSHSGERKIALLGVFRRVRRRGRAIARLKMPGLIFFVATVGGSIELGTFDKGARSMELHVRFDFRRRENSALNLNILLD